MSVAVIDMGTNSTRLLVTELGGGKPREIVRRSTVTRLGRGVETSGQLATEAMDGVCDVLAGYLELAAAHSPAKLRALATSAVRDADNGGAFIAELRERFALDAEVIDGETEARLTYRGATAGRRLAGRTLVVDIGGGSTELVVGEPDGSLRFHESLQLGVVRHGERFLLSDPPGPEELETLGRSVNEELEAARVRYDGPPPEHAIAVAGTPTSMAAIELGLDAADYGADAVEGHVLELESLQRHLGRLASMPLAERREVRGLDPDRAPTIVAGLVILIGSMHAFGLKRVEVSENDVMLGAALEAAA
jgi:exopolyphosphatase / guanosine-5'-triphosphate,3'-diphosphate pyrophosphatase